jgi:PAS domain S-box-containing protein
VRVELLAAIVESADEAIISKDLAGTVTSWNPAAERLYGYSAEEMIGRPVAGLVPPDRPGEVRAILARIEAGERIERLETERLTSDGRRPQGSVDD